MKIKKICPTCGMEFISKSERNIYCCRQHFKKAYYHRKKAEELHEQKNPAFTCPACGQHIILDFDPINEPQKWTEYSCPGCNTLMISVSEEINTKDEAIS